MCLLILDKFPTYLKKEEYIRKHLWKTEKEFVTDMIRAVKERIR